MTATTINGTVEEISAYYLGNAFQFGDTHEHPADKLVRATNVEFLEHMKGKTHGSS